MSEDEEKARIAEWPDEAATAIDIQAVPHELMAEPTTDPHALMRSAEFLAGVEVGRAEGEKDGFARGFEAGDAHGYARNVSETDAAEAVFAALRLALFTAGIEHGPNFAEHVRSLIKPPAPASAGPPSGPRSVRRRR